MTWSAAERIRTMTVRITHLRAKKGAEVRAKS
jgi:hypothetical protein